MKKFNLKIKAIGVVLAAVLLLFISPAVVNANADETVYLGGFVTGFEIKTDGTSVIGVSDVVTENGVKSPSKDAGVLPGDTLLYVGETKINTPYDIEVALKNYKSGKVVLRLKRDGNEIVKEVIPEKDLTGKLRLGLFVRDGASGIGTVTFVKKDGEFTALGHPVCEGDKITEASGGNLYRCSVFGVTKGERGKAGELKGVFVGDAPIGTISKNTEQGIKGKMNKNFDKSSLSEIETGEASIGEAAIIATIDGVKREEFKIAIVKSDKNKKTRNYLIKITDKRLISIAGGIVQGMSGSPIVQDGKLVGAVTHVFVNDPTRGYGISVANML
ncbi:MAG TPA: SpoIVB peptidase [Clostridiales bacterium]|nr:SpoIVB peptidase [Clostridiales bacterium]